MGRIPGGIAAAGAIEMADLGGTFCGAAGIVFTGVVGASAKSRAVGLRAVRISVLIGRVTRAIKPFHFLVMTVVLLRLLPSRAASKVSPC